MLTEEQARKYRIPLGDGWTVANSPFAAFFDDTAGGQSVMFLGEPRVGKTTAVLLLGYRLFRYRRTWLRCHLDTNWVWLFGRRAVVWVPEGVTFRIPGENVTVRTYSDLSDLLVRAKKGELNVLAWDEGEAPVRWTEFNEALLHRQSREPEVVMDEEIQQVAPEGASGHGPDSPYGTMVRWRVIVEQGPKTWVSYILASHQGHDTDYRVTESAIYAGLMCNATPPNKFSRVALPILGAIPHLGKGWCFFVGQNAEGRTWYQRIHFVRSPKWATPRHAIQITAPPKAEPSKPALVAPPSPWDRGRGTRRTLSDFEEIFRLKSEGRTQAEVAALTGWSVRTVRDAWNRGQERTEPQVTAPAPTESPPTPQGAQDLTRDSKPEELLTTLDPEELLTTIKDRLRERRRAARAAKAAPGVG